MNFLFDQKPSVLCIIKEAFNTISDTFARYWPMFYRTLLFIPLFLILTAAMAQDSPAKISKSLQAVRIDQPVQIDGDLNDVPWINAPVANEFIQLEPAPGQPAVQKTEVKILYDDVAIYVGAVMYDTSGKPINTELSDRDNINVADWFGVFIDCYRDGLNGVGMIITASGVENDAKYSVLGEDFSWDAVWSCKVKVTDQKWTAEFRIPYSALRFPGDAEQTWRINFGRFITHSREKSFWSEIDPEVNGFLNQAGMLNGIKNIKPPIRLALYPYVAAYYENYNDKSANPSENSYGFNGGLDLKYGINDAFTLDMTLVPYFGQVQSDAQVLNLSPFETHFDEKRQFFTEGTELFNKGGLFYSRRVGGTPIGYYDVYGETADNEVITENPAQSQLINATKISGRTGNNLGIGFFNAVSTPTHAVITNTDNNSEREVLTDPLTNYNVLVFDQGLKNNSYVTFINTNVMREGSYYDANVTGGEFQVNNKKQSYGIYANAAVSQKYYGGLKNPETGFNTGLNLRKISGKFTGTLWQYIQSDTYDPNDLGYLPNNNTWGEGADAYYNIYDPFGPFLSMSFSLNTSYVRLYNPNEFHNFSIGGEWWMKFRNYLAGGIFFYTEPVITYDWWEPRTPGRFYTYPINHNIGGWFESDYTKKFAFSFNTNYRKFIEDGRYRFNFYVSPRFRLNDHLSFAVNYFHNSWINDVGYVDDEAGKILFGIRNNITNELSLNGSYVFNNAMGISLNVRHYWSFADYSSVKELDEEGMLVNTEWSEQFNPADYNINYNAFTVDMVYRWRFAPGSEIDIVWKNAIYQYAQGKSSLVDDYVQNFETTFDAPATNNLSVKLIYYIDYLMVKNWFKKDASSAFVPDKQNNAHYSGYPMDERNMYRPGM
ncbi:MAG: carbohydrate binding family 9 domain-containing protein [Chitinophagaceae bacterium]|nr:carbohydrate binding family 9 domain-containing protein [Chitinophagaceae bacterium]